MERRRNVIASHRPTRITAAASHAISVAWLYAIASPRESTITRAVIAQIVSNQVSFHSPLDVKSLRRERGCLEWTTLGRPGEVVSAGFAARADR